MKIVVRFDKDYPIPLWFFNNGWFARPSQVMQWVWNALNYPDYESK